uniref:Envelope glycoprotein H n=1 Tax=Human herpesvirus 2 TaxID=10310 RepID=A0A1U9ZEZ8_HHV2|nr:envelope glycoprotein H [Human alphaherpesvirus 2]
MGPGLWVVMGVLVGVAGGHDTYWTEQIDPWFLHGLGLARTYWRDTNTGRLWLPNTPDASDPQRGRLAPPGELNLTTASVPMLRWYAERFCFVLVTTAEFPRDPGQLLYIPKTYLLGRPRNASLPELPEAGPTSRPPAEVTQLKGLSHNPGASALLRSRAWVTFAAAPDREGLTFPRGDDGATERHPDGRRNAPPPGPPAGAPRHPTTNLSIAHLHNASVTWLAARGLLRTPGRYVYLSPSASTWPVGVWTTGGLAFGCDAALVRARYGKGFMGLVISMRDSPPAEIIVVPADKTLARVGNPTDENAPAVLPGPPAGPRYRVFVLGAPTPADNGSALDALRRVAGYPEESTNYAQYMSRAYAEFLGEDPGSGTDARPSLFWRLAGLLASSGFAFVNAAHAHDAIRLSDLLGFLAHSRVLAGLAARGAAGCAADSVFLNVSVLDPAARLRLEARLGHLVAAILEREQSLAAHALGYQLAFVLDSPAAYGAVAPSAARLIDALYAEFLGGRALTTPMVRRALFYATAVLRAPFLAGAPSAEQRERARRGLLITTALCTSDVAAATHADLRAALAMTDHQKNLFWLPDHFSPCAASLRFDLAEGGFILDALAMATRSDIPADVMAQQTRGVASALTRWAHYNALIRAFVPEATHQCSGPSHNAEPRILVPITHNASYVVTHTPLPRGIGYKLTGVDVRRPLFITYLTATCEGHAREIEPKRLVRTENRRDLGLVGAVFLRYTPAGEVMSVLLVDTDATQQQLAQGPVAGTPNVFSSDVPSVALLLFPNGTVIHLLAFDTLPIATIAPGFLAASALGVVMITAALAGILRVVRTCVPFLWRRE